MLYLVVNTKTIMRIVYYTYKFTNEIIIPHLMYWVYAHMDV